ncbi:MAG: presenilin family intramembrane aspartyl protease [Candidatus Bathyarchaeia archaeon]|jgi:presenilin-like A22 family membrane protease
MTTPQAPTEQPSAKPESAEDKFKFQVIYLLPILASMLFGLVCAWVLLPQPAAVIPVTPIPESTPGAPLGNALYFVILIAISATIFYVLLKRRSKRIIKGLIVVALTTASMLLSVVYLSALASYVPAMGDWLIILLSIVITALFDLAIFKFGSAARNAAVILIGGALGIFFGWAIPLWSAIVILAFLAIYDVIAVYKGPVGKIAQTGLDDLQGLSFSFKDIQMGLGDLVFYSMLTGAMLFNFIPSFFPVIAAIIGIMAGSIVTFFMLEKKGIFPGLPFPILFGLVFGLAVGFLL